MEILINSKDETICLNKNMLHPFNIEDKLLINCNKISFELDLFNAENSSKIKLLSMKFPNKKNISLETIRKISDLFPFLNEKYYEKTKITTFETEQMDEITTPIVVIVDCNSSFYTLCLAVLGGEYSRNPGTNIVLLDIRQIGSNVFDLLA